ncbi:MAG: hypothetical protein AAF597_08325 [Bacteroidota bacterium]
MGTHFSITVTVCQQAFPLDLKIGPNGELLQAKDHFRKLPEVAQRLTLGDTGPTFYRRLDLYLDLLHYAVPLWYHGLSTPDSFQELILSSSEQLSIPPRKLSSTVWVAQIQRTFNDHGPHWYHVAHVLTQVIRDLSKLEVDWTQIVYLLQAGGPFFEPIISRLLPREITDSGLRARLLNALLFFPDPPAWKTAEQTLPILQPGKSIGHQSLVRTLNNFEHPESHFYQKRFFEYANYTNAYLAIHAGLDRLVSSCQKAAWRAIERGNHTNQTDVEYLLRDPQGRINELVETLAKKPDWCELLGRFRREFLSAGYQGSLVPDLDGFVTDNLNRYKWPSGERHHNRIDPDVRHALYQERLQPQTLRLLHERLADKDRFRRDCAAMHLAAYVQLPRILVRRTKEGNLTAYFQETPQQRPPLSAETVSALLSLTTEDRRITAYHFAARAVSQLAIDETHGQGITEYLITRAQQDTDGKDLVFCSYLLLLTYHFQQDKASIRLLLQQAIPQVAQQAQAAFGRLLVQLHDPELTHAFLQRVAPGQAEKTYAMFEELAQAVNLLDDQHYRLPLAAFHPEFAGLSLSNGRETAD